MRLQRFKGKIVGFLLILSVMLSAYTLVVQAVQQFNNRLMIDQLSLFGSKDLNENRTQFHAGEILTLCAKVREGDVYHLSIYDKNGSVFSQDGRIVGSEVVVQVPLNPPSFRAGESYVIVFNAVISCYPIPGAFATDEKTTSFDVVKAGTKLYLLSVYDDNSYRLSLNVCLKNEEGNPIANKNINLYLQTNCSALIQDRGWVPLVTVRTDASGCVALPMLCRLYGGLHFIKVTFDGDCNFGKSENTTKFYTALRVPRLIITKVSNSLGRTDVSAKIVDEQGYPLFGKMLTVDFGNSTALQTLLSTTDGKGEIALSFKGSEQLALNRSIFKIGGDLFTSALSVDFRTLVSSKNVGMLLSSTAEYPAQQEYVMNEQGLLDLSIYPSNPYAVLPMKLTATYTGNVPSSTNVTFHFYLDGLYDKGYVSLSGQGQSTYVGLFPWCPNVIGGHFMKVEARLLDGTLLNQITSGNFTINPCPCNLEIYAPQVTYGNSADVTFVFSRPRAYSPSNGSGLFSSFNLAPEFNYTGVVHKIDSDSPGATVRLYYSCTDPDKTEYLRDVQISVNGLYAYQLNASQGTTYTANWLCAQTGTVATWGIRIWSRSNTGVETNINSSSPVARVHMSALGQGLLNTTWNCPTRSLNPNDSIVIRWYVGRGTNPSTWTLLASSTTQPLGTTQLNASIWKVVYYASVDHSETYNKYDYGLWWGNSIYNTRITNFTYLPNTICHMDLTFDTNNGATTKKAIITPTSLHQMWNFTLMVLDPLFEKKIVTRIITFSRVAVSAANGNSFLNLTCSLNAANGTSPQVYVGANSTVSVGASLFGMPLYNANASIVYAKFVSAAYNKTGMNVGSPLPIPDGTNLLRVVYVYNNSALDADINYKLVKNDDWTISADGQIEIKDVSLVSANLGKTVPPADPRADINRDHFVNITDENILTAYEGQTGTYLRSFGAYADFGISGHAHDYVDSGGCVQIPAGAHSVTVYLSGQHVGLLLNSSTRLQRINR